MFCYFVLTWFGCKHVTKYELYAQGDTKGPARGADGSAKKDALGTQLGSDAQVTI